MTVTFDPSRQETIAARVTGTFGTGNDIGALGTYQVMEVPGGAIVVGGHFNISDATTATVDIHIGDGSDDNRYADNIDGAATGLTALTITGYKYTSSDTIDIMVDTAAPAADGTWELTVLYIVDGRSAFDQGIVEEGTFTAP